MDALTTTGSNTNSICVHFHFILYSLLTNVDTTLMSILLQSIKFIYLIFSFQNFQSHALCDGQIGRIVSVGHICDWTFGTYTAFGFGFGFGFKDMYCILSVRKAYVPIAYTFVHSIWNCQDNKININKMNNNKNIEMMI